jgi:hypothetical protein
MLVHRRLTWRLEMSSTVWHAHRLDHIVDQYHARIPPAQQQRAPSPGHPSRLQEGRKVRVLCAPSEYAPRRCRLGSPCPDHVGVAPTDPLGAVLTVLGAAQTLDFDLPSKASSVTHGVLNQSLSRGDQDPMTTASRRSLSKGLWQARSLAACSARSCTGSVCQRLPRRFSRQNVPKRMSRNRVLVLGGQGLLPKRRQSADSSLSRKRLRQ